MTIDVAAKSGALTRSLAESYYRLSAAAAATLVADVARAPSRSSSVLTTLGLTPFTTGARPATSSLRGYKHTGPDVLVVVQGQLSLPSRGSYGLRIATTSPLARIAVSVGQRRLSWSSAGNNTYEARLLVDTAPAWYEFEVLYAGSVEGIEFAWSLPTSFNMWGSLPEGWLITGTMAPVTPLPYVPRDMPTARNSPASEVPAAIGGFQVLWRTVAPSNIPADASPGTPADPAASFVYNPGFLSSLSPDQHYNYSVFLDDLNFASGTSLANALAGGAASASRADAGALAAATASGPVYGTATTYIQSIVDGPSTVVFRVTCTHCQLYLDGLLFHETLDAAYVPGSAAPPATTTRVTPCVTLDPVRNPNATGVNRPRHQLQIRFATSASAPTAGLVIQQAACSSPPPTTFASLRPLMAPAPWYKATSAPASTASTNGSIQCDVWDSATVGRQEFILQPGNIPRPEDVPPLVRFRLPDARATSFPCPWGQVCPSGINFTTALAAVVPMASLPSYSYIRCWAWASRGFRGGLVAVYSSEQIPTAVYLADRAVFLSGDWKRDWGMVREVRAPNTTLLGGQQYRQIMAAEWHMVSPNLRQSLVEGRADTPTNVPAGMPIDTSFFAPLP
ncbi:hypothetical protein PLESTB_000018700 [Pleodorina starrii]|uniref:Uncharacterized protein n=1 Tax=Pleodorina starrii TaxID=330485 RepID=A0A9W6BA33_9CHLO|nr:hypothetical protein PLESTB_000018700 [Pleodorina starrii]